MCSESGTALVWPRTGAPLSRTLPVTIKVPGMDEIWNAAALKGQYALSCSDAFAAALAPNPIALWSPVRRNSG